MSSKFSIGDKVVIKRMSDRTPKEVLETVRLDHPRTITQMFYDQRAQHNIYYLGTNWKGETDVSYIPFRACQLEKWESGRPQGRPREKRRYIRRKSLEKVTLSK